jgi:YbbR domain-containing protein
MGFSSNRGLKIFALFLAIGIVWIKGQDRIDSRVLTNIQVVVENLPDNIIQPTSTIPPTTTAEVYGPRNIIELIRSDQSNFRIDLSLVPITLTTDKVNILLTDSMFKTSLDAEERSRIKVIEETLRPRQVELLVIPWFLDKERKPFSGSQRTPDVIQIPIYRLLKSAKVIVPLHGEPDQDFELSHLAIEPEEIVVTGKREAIELIQSVSTPPLDMTGLKETSPSIYLPLENIEERASAVLVDNTIRGVTVTIHLKKKGK